MRSSWTGVGQRVGPGAQRSVLTQRLAPVRFRMSSSSLGIMGASHFSWKRSKDEGLGTFDSPSARVEWHRRRAHGKVRGMAG